MNDPNLVRSAPWAVLVPSGTTTVTVRRGLRGRRAAARELSGLPTQRSVVLVGSGPVNRSRLRRTAETAGVVIEHEYVVLPSVHSGRYVIEDDPDAMAVLWDSLMTPPPGVTWPTALLTVLTNLARSWLPWWALGTVAPRVAFGHRGAQP